jgi:hypothetical protein
MLARRPGTHCVTPATSIEPSFAVSPELLELGHKPNPDADFVAGDDPPRAATTRATTPQPSHMNERIATSPSGPVRGVPELQPEAKNLSIHV